MTAEWLAFPPGFVLLAAAPLACVVGRARAWLLLAPLAALLLAALLPDDAALRLHFLGHAVAPLEVTALGRLFAITFSLMALGGTLFALRQAKKSELAGALTCAGSAVTLTLCGDFITFFVFWELLAAASTLIVFSTATPAAAAAGKRYALLHVLGGVVLLYGIVGLIGDSGDAALRPVALDTPYAWMMLAGMLINAGAPPLSAWVADAYPEASPGGMVFLAAFTTKSAVYALLATFAGSGVLVPVGLYMIFYGIVYALLENDMRRILAYSIVNQVGFMVVGAGIGTEIAVNGAAAHASAHVIYKALLLMSAGSVLYMSGRRKCTDLGGLYQTMKVTTICGVVGAVSISAAPLTSGFVSKALIGEAAHAAAMTWTWLALLAASAGVFLHAGIKFPWFVFFRRRPGGSEPYDPPINMQLAMILFALLCIAVGVFPSLLYGLLPYPVDYAPYAGAHVVAQLQLLLLSALAFFLMLPWMKRTMTISLDTDWFYRALPPRICAALAPALAAGMRALRGCDARRALYAAAANGARRIERAPLLFAVILGALALLLLLHYRHV